MVIAMKPLWNKNFNLDFSFQIIDYLSCHTAASGIQTHKLQLMQYVPKSKIASVWCHWIFFSHLPFFSQKKFSKLNLGSVSYLLHEIPCLLPDQMFHILVQACLTEKLFKFGFNRKNNCFCVVLCFVVFDSLKLWSTLFDSLKLRLMNVSGHENVKHLVG